MIYTGEGEGVVTLKKGSTQSQRRLETLKNMTKKDQARNGRAILRFHSF